MKKHAKEIIIFVLQFLMFYVFPLFAGPTDAIGMVLLIWLSTIISGLTIGLLSTKKIKYFYPLIVAILFIPSVFIYYNESALVHSIWYLVSSSVGVIIGFIINKLFNKKKTQ